MAKKNKMAKHDFLESQLPSTRRKQFFDIITHRYGLILKLGLLMALFFLPLLLSVMVKDAFLIIIRIGNYDDVPSRQFAVNVIYCVAIFVSLIIFFIGQSGFFKIYKELIYGDPIFLKEDFIHGIKENIKPFLVISSFVGLFYVAEILISLLFDNVYIQIIPFAFNLALIFPLCYVSTFLSTYYSNGFMVNLKTSFALYLRRFPLELLGYVLSFGMIFFQYISLIYVKYALLIFFVIFLLPLSILVGHEANAAIFDELINQSQFPSFYKKGLYKKD